MDELDPSIILSCTHDLHPRPGRPVGLRFLISVLTYNSNVKLYPMSTSTSRYSEDTAVEQAVVKEEVVFNQDLGSENETSPPVQTSPDRTLLKTLAIVIVAASAMTIDKANTTSISISLATIEKEWQLQPEQLQWLVSAYPLSSGCLFLLSGRLADLYGRKRAFCVGTLFLSVITLACSFSPDITTLITLRAIQGIGSAITIPASVGIVAQSFPPSRALSLAFATFGAAAHVGAFFGTSVGGVLAEYTSKTWRTVFYILCGLNVLSFVCALVIIPEDVPSEETDKRVDWIGAFLVTTGLVFIIFVLSQGKVAPHEWGTPYIITLLILGVFFVLIFLYWQHYLEAAHKSSYKLSRSAWTPPPLMKLSIWSRANGRFGALLGLAFASSCGYSAWYFWVQLYYQNYLKYKPLITAVRLYPIFVGGVASEFFVGFMASRVPVVYLFVASGLCATLSSLLFAIIKPRVTYWAYGFIGTLLSPIGLDTLAPAAFLFIARAALSHEQSVGGALLNTMLQLGTATGVTVSTVVYNSVDTRIAPGADMLSKYNAAQWAAFSFNIIASVVAIALIWFRGVGIVGSRQPKSVTRALPDTVLGIP